MKFKNKKFIMVLILVISLYTFFIIGNTFLPIEQLSIPSIIGIDIIQPNSSARQYKITTAIYNFHSNIPNKDLIIQSFSTTLGQNREKNQLQLPSKFLPGMEKVILFGTKLSKDSLKNILNLIFTRKTSTDTTVVAIADDVESIVKFKVPNYTNSGDYIEGMINTLNSFNFFPDTYTLMDIFTKVDTEGKNIVLPYISIQDERLQVTGLALFNKYNLIDVININDAKFLNLLRETNVYGNLSIKKSKNMYTDYFAYSKRKVECTKENGKYKFIINLDLSGEIICNEIYKDLITDPKVMNKFEEDISKVIESELNIFIKKMQNKYELDVFELGKYAVAKYGRSTSTDWNKVASTCDIEAHVKAKISGFGRGDF